MKRTLMRRSIAVVASAGLVFVGIPLTTAPAQAQTEACALGATCDGVVSGALGDSPYQIRMPEKFNGTVMLFSHGYRFGVPVPAAFAGPTALNLIGNPNYTATQVPGLAANFGTDTAFAGNNNPQVAPNEKVAANLLAQGYALVGAGYARQGWAVAEGVEAGENLIRLVNSGAVPRTKQIVTWGESMGGNISVVLAERNPKRVAGVLPLCGAFSGPVELFSSAMTALFTWKALATPNLKIANYAAGPAGYAQAMGDLGTVLGALGQISAGQLNPQSLSPAGVPYLQANLLGGLMAGLPTKSAVYDGESLNPAIVTDFGGNPSAASAAGYSPVTAGASTAVAMLQNIGSAAALGILGRYELEQRARTALQLAPTDNANFNDNVPVRYSRLLSDEQRGEFGDILNASPLVPNLLNVMVDKLDASVGDTSFRYAANPAVVQFVRSLPSPKGTYSQPIVMMTTTYDPVTPDGNQGMLTNLLEASYKKQGRKAGLNKIVSMYTIPAEGGYTKFAPGGLTPDTAASLAANVSGEGHCQFMKLGDGVQLTNAVQVLNRMMNAKTQKQVAAARRLGFNTPGVNNDRAYRPDALKRPLATAAR
jgi:pimeloyl-ACP methyl ester carboxylesterase